MRAVPAPKCRGRAFSIQASLRVERSSCKMLFSIVSPHLEIVILSEGCAKRKPESKDLAINESPFMIMVWRGRRISFGAASGLTQDDSARRSPRQTTIYMTTRSCGINGWQEITCPGIWERALPANNRESPKALLAREP